MKSAFCPAPNTAPPSMSCSQQLRFLTDKIHREQGAGFRVLGFGGSLEIGVLLVLRRQLCIHERAAAASRGRRGRVARSSRCRLCVAAARLFSLHEDLVPGRVQLVGRAEL